MLEDFVKHFVEIALSRTVSEINAILCFMYKFKMGAKMAGKQFLEKKLPDDSGDTLGSNISLKSCTVLEVNALLYFMQNFKMAAKMARKQFLEKKSQMTLRIPFMSKIH